MQRVEGSIIGYPEFRAKRKLFEKRLQEKKKAKEEKIKKIHGIRDRGVLYKTFYSLATFLDNPLGSLIRKEHIDFEADLLSIEELKPRGREISGRTS